MKTSIYNVSVQDDWNVMKLGCFDFIIAPLDVDNAWSMGWTRSNNTHQDDRVIVACYQQQRLKRKAGVGVGWGKGVDLLQASFPNAIFVVGRRFGNDECHLKMSNTAVDSWLGDEWGLSAKFWTLIALGNKLAVNSVPRWAQHKTLNVSVGKGVLHQDRIRCACWRSWNCIQYNASMESAVFSAKFQQIVSKWHCTKWFLNDHSSPNNK